MSAAAQQRRRAQAEQTARAAEAASRDALRLSTVLRVDARAAADGRDQVVLDWTGDGSVPVPARSDPDRVFARGDEVLVAMVGRSPFVICKSSGAPAAPPE